jgi:hypothetical protein
MALKVLRFVSLLLVTLIFGLAFCHVMEVPGKFRLNGSEWLAVQQNLYVTFGAADRCVVRGAVDPVDVDSRPWGSQA